MSGFNYLSKAIVVSIIIFLAVIVGLTIFLDPILYDSVKSKIILSIAFLQLFFVISFKCFTLMRFHLTPIDSGKLRYVIFYSIVYTVFAVTSLATVYSYWI